MGVMGISGCCSHGGCSPLGFSESVEWLWQP